MWKNLALTSLSFILIAIEPAHAQDDPLAQTKAGPEIISQGLGYRTMSDEGRGLSYIQISRHPDNQMMARVNAILSEKAIGLYNFQSQCHQAASAGISHYVTRVRYFTSSILVIDQEGDMTCGPVNGAHIIAHPTYDLRRGQIMDFNLLLKLYIDPAEAGFPNGPNKIRTDEFVAFLLSLSPESPYALPTAKAKTTTGKACFVFMGQNAPPFSNYDSYKMAFTDVGLLLTVSRADNPELFPCSGDYFLVPYKAITPLMRPEAKNYLPVSQ
jgi:hypothetical protein